MRNIARKILVVIGIVLIALTVQCFPSFASVEVLVKENICSKSYKSDSILPIEPKVKFIFQKGHGDMDITIGTLPSLAFYTDPSGMGSASATPPISALIAMVLDGLSSQLPPGVCSNVYHIDFYDYGGNRVWSGILPNGGSRDYYIGSNIDYIGVWSYYDTPYGLGQNPINVGEVYYENARSR